MSEYLMFPKFLRGTHAQVAAAYTSLVAMMHDDVDGLVERLRSLEMLDVSKEPSKIIISDVCGHQLGFTDPTSSHFRLYVVMDSLVPLELDYTEHGVDLKNYTPLLPVVSLQRKYILVATRFLWFTIAMLQPIRNSPVLYPVSGYESVDDVRAVFLIPLLRRIVYWLPQIVLLLPRLHFGATVTFPVLDPTCPEHWWSVWSFFFSLLAIYDHSIPIDELRFTIEHHHKFDLIAALVAKGVLIEQGCTYCLR